MPTLARAAAPALLCLALLAGCGNDDEAKPRATPTPTGLAKTAFLTQAEAICTKANAHIEAQPAPESPAQISPAFAQVVEYADTVTSQLEDLAAHQPDKAELDRIFLTPLRRQVAALEAYAPKLDAAVKQGEAAFKALPEPALPDADLAAMRTYGFQDCVTLAEND